MPRLARTTRLAARAAASAAALAALFAAACADATGPKAADGGSGSADASVPAAIVGSWRYGSVSPSNFWDDHTDVYSGNAYGISDQYVFNRDGTYKEYLYVYTQTYGCRTQAWVEMSGPVHFTDGSFTTQVADGHFKTIDPCAPSHNKDRPMTDDERNERGKTQTYALRTDDAGKTYLAILDGRYDPAN
ncbi:hypothetical protein tb265_12700 [Gemmatimonadetes bacterium T265]|nr:hypothetical protein tb265_12700 [Gemmatimonadetes bacterium T265]